MKLQTKIILQKTLLPASPAEVYDAYTDPKKHSEFTGSKATGKPVVGGKFTAWDGYIFGKYLELEEGSCVVQEWMTTDWVEGYPPSRLELTFKQVADGTEVSMVHANVPAEQEEELRQGWADFYWEPLKEYFAKLKSKSK